MALVAALPRHPGRLLAYLAAERRRLRGRGFSIIESSTVLPPLPAV